MGRRKESEYLFGTGVVTRLVPQRRPMLMVDGVASFRDGSHPTLRAYRQVSGNEVFFDGHFPEFPVWPGALTMEGLGQTATILVALVMLRGEAERLGQDPDSVLAYLVNLDRQFRLHPGFRPMDEPEAFRTLRSRSVPPLAGSVELKFLRPVFPGCRLEYEVTWTDTVAGMLRFSGTARVDEEPVARGVLMGAWPDGSRAGT